MDGRIYRSNKCKLKGLKKVKKRKKKVKLKILKQQLTKLK